MPDVCHKSTTIIFKFKFTSVTITIRLHFKRVQIIFFFGEAFIAIILYDQGKSKTTHKNCVTTDNKKNVM